VRPRNHLGTGRGLQHLLRSTSFLRPERPATGRSLGEQKLFEFRKLARLGQKAQLKERYRAAPGRNRGPHGQAKAKRQEIEFINEELKGVRELWLSNSFQSRA